MLGKRIHSVLQSLEKKLFLIMPSPSLPPRRSNKVASSRSRADASTNASKPSPKKQKTSNSNPAVLAIASVVTMLCLIAIGYAFLIPGESPLVASSEQATLRQSSKSEEELHNYESEQEIDVSTLASTYSGDTIDNVFDQFYALYLDSILTISDCTPESKVEHFDEKLDLKLEQLIDLVRRSHEIAPLPIREIGPSILAKQLTLQKSLNPLKEKLNLLGERNYAAGTKNSKKLDDSIEFHLSFLKKCSLAAEYAISIPPDLPEELQDLTKVCVELKNECRQVGRLMSHQRWKQAAKSIIAFEEKFKVIAETYGQLKARSGLSPDAIFTLKSVAVSGEYVVVESYILKKKCPEVDITYSVTRLKTAIDKIFPK